LCSSLQPPVISTPHGPNSLFSDTLSLGSSIGI
jgi:hypothetical protein